MLLFFLPVSFLTIITFLLVHSFFQYDFLVYLSFLSLPIITELSFWTMHFQQRYHNHLFSILSTSISRSGVIKNIYTTILLMNLNLFFFVIIIWYFVLFWLALLLFLCWILILLCFNPGKRTGNPALYILFLFLFF